MRRCTLIATLVSAACLCTGCATQSTFSPSAGQANAMGTSVRLEPSVVVLNQRSDGGEFRIGAGDALGRAIFAHYAMLARTGQLNSSQHVAGVSGAAVDPRSR